MGPAKFGAARRESMGFGLGDTSDTSALDALSPSGLEHRAGRVLWLVALVALRVAPAYGGGEAEAAAIPWSYDGERGPAHWGDLAPELALCSNGSQQSPIDIPYRTGREVQPIGYTPLMFQYRSQGLSAINDGREVRVLAVPGSDLHIRGERYALQEVRFRVPGEHRIDGVASAGEIHLVHRNAAGQIAIVAVPLTVGPRLNSILVRILDLLPAVPGERVYHEQVGINPLFLLPPERDYFSYIGSLDTPPCSEPVTWFVMVHALEIDPVQLQRLARITGNNARPVQPLNGRPVYLARRGR